ncbi:hypothetical protein [Paenibacillus albidus]|uniref:hypothetical protein n=1 Tax=Paenibacillus albidus TaxID=2041023 RepID=UPI001E4B88CF|nr:hypothetical protein [Paenibacillus albidus]
MKAEGTGRKVHSLIDKVYHRTNLEMAWETVRANGGSGETDKVRVCQQALKNRLESIFEPLFSECSFGYRQAGQRIKRYGKFTAR